MIKKLIILIILLFTVNAYAAYEYTGLPITVSGWTDFDTMLDGGDYDSSRVIFVSDTDGNDGTGQVEAITDVSFDANGMFQAVGTAGSDYYPYQTISAGYAQIRDGYADILLLDRGDSWSGGFDSGSYGNWTKSGASATAPIIFASYGSGDRPIMLVSGSYVLFTVYNAGYIFVSGIAFFDDAASGAIRALDVTGTSPSVMFEDCHIKYCTKAKFQGGSVTAVIRRCIFQENGASNDGALYVANLQSFVFNENIIFEPLYAAVSTAYGRGIYYCGEDTPTLTGVVAKRNILYRHEQGGFDARRGGEFDNNLFVQSGMSFQSNGGSDEDYIITGSVTNNCFLEGQPNTGNASALALSNVDVAEVSGNLFTDPTGITEADHVAIAIGQNGDTVFWLKNVDVTDNIIYDYAGSGAANTAVQFMGVLTDIADNTFDANHLQMGTGSTRVLAITNDDISGTTWTNNKYYSTDTESDWFAQGNHAAWVTASSETGSTKTEVSYTASTRTIKTYNQTLGGSADTDEFMNAALAQARHNWDTDYMANTVNNYLRAGFDMDAVTVTYGDAPAETCSGMCGVSLIGVQ